MPTWADLERLRRSRHVRALEQRPRWVLWAVLAVLFLDARAVVHLRGDEGSACAEGVVPVVPASLRTSLAVLQPTTRSGDDVQVVLRLENTGPEEVVVAGLQALVVEPAGDRVLGWAEPVRPLGLVVRPGEFGEVPLVAHLRGCRDRPETALAPGWYELVVVVVEGHGRSRSAVRPIVVAP